MGALVILDWAPSCDTCGANAARWALGWLSGLKGGPTRAEKLSSERRREIARTAG
jgi:hypothetical protein